MTLDIQSNIENELIRIIREAIDCRKIDTESIRMIVLCADESFQKLEVRIKNDWDTYFEKEYAALIGEINISQWLDVADHALENILEINASYIERAKEIENKYSLTAPAINFDHLAALPPSYIAFLVCLREELIEQVNAGICNAAISFSQTDFKQIVSFFTHKLTYDLDDTMLLHAFSHPEGTGPFYKVELTQPDYIRSDRYLRFYDRGFHMFRVAVSLLDDESENETEVISYDISEIAFMFLRDKDFFFRPNTAFKNWYVEADRPNIEKGEYSEREFLKNVEDFFNQFPEKVFNPINIPDPINQKEAFDHWFNIVIEYNIPIVSVHLKIIFSYGEDAFRYYLQSIPKAHSQEETALSFLASRLFYQNRFEEALEAYDSIKSLTEYDQIEYLCALYLLNLKERYETYQSTTKVEKLTLELLDTLWMLRVPHNNVALNSIEEKFVALVPIYKNSQTIRLLSLVLVKICIRTHNKEQALLHLQSIPADETIEQLLALHEFRSVDYIHDAYHLHIQKWQKRVDFDKQAESNSLKTADKKKTNLTKTSYDYSYYFKTRIRVSDYKWAYPIDAETYIAISENKEYELILVKIISGESIEIRQQLSIPASRRARSCVYLDGIVYIADKEEGIVTYKVTETSIEQTPIIYKNKLKKAKYETITIAGDYLFASNNSYLEIYNLNEPEADVLCDSFYIGSGYHLFVHNNLLVIGAGGGLLILADISDKKNPVCLSTIQEDTTPNDMYVVFIDNYIVSRSVYNISNPEKPEWIQYIGEELSPIYYFSSKPEVPIISTREDFLFTTLVLKDNKPLYTNWRESLDNQHTSERAVYNLATGYFEETVITYSRYEIKLWKKGLSPVVEQINIHNEVERMVNTCFDFIEDEHHTFRIGKAILQYDPLYQHIDISFHQSSSLAVLTNSNKTHSVPIISSTLLLYTYCEELLQKHYNPATTHFVYDGDAIMEKMICDPRFEDLCARHVLILSGNNGSYKQYATKSWQSFRIGTAAEAKEETITDIILSRNDAFIDQLIHKIADNATLLDELLDILNKKIFVPQITSSLSSNKINTEEAAEIIAELHALTDSETDTDSGDDDEIYCSPAYIVDPYYTPEKEKKQNETVPSKFLPNTMETFDLQNKAFEILCRLRDRELVRTILFNGMQYGYMHYNVKYMPADYGMNEKLITEFVRNNHGTWNEFGTDTDIRYFLMSNINAFHDTQLQIRIAYKCGHLSHPLISEYIQNIIEGGMSYEALRGEMTDIDLSTFPEEVIRPFESLLLEKSIAFENTTDTLLLIDAEQQAPYLYALLYKLGHEHMPEIVRKKIEQAVKEQEQYGNLTFDDDEYEFDNAFLVKLYREIKVRRLLHYYKNTSDVLWPLAEPTERYQESWKNTIEVLFEQGSEAFGDAFKINYIERLAKNIALNETYANDRTLSYELVQYAYKNIQKKPQLASLIEPLVLAIDANKDVFPADLNVAALKDKNKYTLLQSAWNDLKDQQLDLAEQKADAVLIMDPNMGQVYFLKARLLWLREGLTAYLQQQEYFIEKAKGDSTVLARLYNLTGCALDIEKRYEEALHYFKKAANSAPNDPMYIANVAEIYYKSGKSKDALQHAKSARANGSEAVILKEIIENKGVLSET